MAGERVNDIGSGLSVVLRLGAAMKDATTEQRAALKGKVTPLLDQFRIDGETWPIDKAIHDILGKSWKPADEWTLSED